MSNRTRIPVALILRRPGAGDREWPVLADHPRGAGVKRLARDVSRMTP